MSDACLRWVCGLAWSATGYEEVCCVFCDDLNRGILRGKGNSRVEGIYRHIVSVDKAADFFCHSAKLYQLCCTSRAYALALNSISFRHFRAREHLARGAGAVASLAQHLHISLFGLGYI